MTKKARKTRTSGAAKAVTVADYIVERLAAEGILVPRKQHNGRL